MKTDDKPIAIAHVSEDLISVLRECESAFTRIIRLAEAYAQQGKQWSRMDANGVIAEMYAATAPVSHVREMIAKATKEI